MITEWDDLVLGGLGQPRILSVGENLCSNSYMNNNVPAINDWQESISGILSRVVDKDAYGEYMAKINYASNLQYAYYTIDIGESISGKKFIIYFRSKSDVMIKASLVGSSEFYALWIFPSSKIKDAVFIGTATGQTGNTITLRIYGTHIIENANVLFDNIYIGIVNDTDFLFPQPQSSSLQFNKIVTGTNTLWNGKIQEFNKMWLPNYIANWDFID